MCTSSVGRHPRKTRTRRFLMRAAIYARVSAPRQARESNTDQQVVRLERHAERQGWVLDGGRVYLDEGHSGANLSRPGLDALRDAAAMAEFELVLVTAPDRLARNYVHQVLLLEELQGRGCRVEFLERPMSQDPNDQLLLQIRGAVAEYERTLIDQRMRRGRLACAWKSTRRPSSGRCSPGTWSKGRPSAPSPGGSRKEASSLPPAREAGPGAP